MRNLNETKLGAASHAIASPGRRRLVLAATAAAACATAGPGAFAQGGFPSKTVSIVVPSAPGGSLDPLARMLQPGLQRRLGQTVLVDNKPGASGQIATGLVARSAPDGHTMLLSFDSHVMNAVVAATMSRKLQTDVFKEFAPVSLVARIPFVLAVSSSVPANTVQEFIAYAKANKGKISYGSSGAGGMSHFAGERFKHATGIEAVHVPYQGAAGIPRLMAGDVQLYFSSYLLMRPGVQNGTIKVLAIADKNRLAEAPQIPTMTEAGFAGFEAYTWYGAYVPAQTPSAVVQRLQADIAATLADADVKARLTDSGFTIIGSTAEELKAFTQGEFDRWRKFVAEVKLTFDE